MLINAIPFPLNVAEGHKVYVYRAGTATLADVYSDVYYSVASQPLLADEYGRVNAYCEESVIDVKVCDEDDHLLYSIERVINTQVFEDAPSDGKEYVRKNGNWVESDNGLIVTNDVLHFG